MFKFRGTSRTRQRSLSLSQGTHGLGLPDAPTTVGRWQLSPTTSSTASSPFHTSPRTHHSASGHAHAALDDDRDEPNNLNAWLTDSLEDAKRAAHVVQGAHTMSIIPEPLLLTDKDGRTVFLPSFKSRYPIHNPVGPRWYKNHHLIPPQQRLPSLTTFPPAFPIMGHMNQNASEDSPRPGPSRTPSGSPLPTPNSSQSRIGEGVPRSRKPSQTAHDEVDLMDGSDPTGQNFHHQSPYDVGLTPSSAPQPSDGPLPPRQRHHSHTGAKRPLYPSPLSQSTPAIPLQSSEQGATIPRRLSKTHRIGLRRLFGTASDESTPTLSRTAASAPVTPQENVSANGFLTVPDPEAPAAPPIHRKLSKRGLTAPPVIAKSTSATNTFASTASSTSGYGPAGSKRGKHGSMLDRFTKKLSILRKPVADVFSRAYSSDDDDGDWEPINSQDPIMRRSLLDNPVPPPEAGAVRSGSPEKQQVKPRRTMESVRRVPPPSIDDAFPSPGPSAPAPPPRVNQSTDSLPLDTPYTMVGKLTIANPDVPSPPGSPDRAPARLPPAPAPAPSTYAPPPRAPSAELPPIPPITPDLGIALQRHLSNTPPSDNERSSSHQRLFSPYAPTVETSFMSPPPQSTTFSSAPPSHPRPRYTESPEPIIQSPSVTSPVSTAKPQHGGAPTLSMLMSPSIMDAPLAPPVPHFSRGKGNTPSINSVPSIGSIPTINTAALGSPLPPPGMSMPSIHSPIEEPEHRSPSVPPPPPEKPDSESWRQSRDSRRLSENRAETPPTAVAQAPRASIAVVPAPSVYPQAQTQAQVQQQQQHQHQQQYQYHWDPPTPDGRTTPYSQAATYNNSAAASLYDHSPMSNASMMANPPTPDIPSLMLSERAPAVARRSIVAQPVPASSPLAPAPAPAQAPAPAPVPAPSPVPKPTPVTVTRPAPTPIQMPVPTVLASAPSSAVSPSAPVVQPHAAIQVIPVSSHASAYVPTPAPAPTTAPSRSEVRAEHSSRDHSSRRRSNSPERPERTHQRSTREPIEASNARGSRREKNKPTTETFRLVRSPSETMRAQGGTVTFGEEQWTVVETGPPPKRERSDKERHGSSSREAERERERSDKERHGSSSRDAERSHRKSGRRHDGARDSGSGEQEKVKEREQRSSEHRSSANYRAVEEAAPAPQQLRKSRSRSMEATTATEPAPAPAPRRGASALAKESSDRRRREEKANRRTSQTGASSSQQQRRPSPQTDTVKSDRRSSTRRPVSEVTNPDGAVLSAREAWEAERLWKGKSVVYGTDAPNIVAAVPGQPVVNMPAYAVNAGPVTTPPTIYTNTYHGSGHTVYMVQTPFTGQAVYHYTHHVAQPYAYASPPPVQSPPQPGPYDYPYTYRSYADSVPFPSPAQSSPTRDRPSQNPLPEPPRQASYNTALPRRSGHQRANSNDPSTPEYWAKYAGIPLSTH